MKNKERSFLARSVHFGLPLIADILMFFAGDLPTNDSQSFSGLVFTLSRAPPIHGATHQGVSGLFRTRIKPDVFSLLRMRWVLGVELERFALSLDAILTLN